MNTRDMQIFIKIADYRSITRTAEDIQMTQPAVSSTLKRIEEELGYSLFTRRGKWLILNAQGKVFYDASREFLGEIAHVQEGLQVDKHHKEEIVIKMHTHSDKLYSLMGQFTEENPDVRMILRQGSANREEAFRKADFEVCMTHDRSLESEFLPLEHHGALYAILPEKHPLACRPQLYLEDLQKEKFVFLRDSTPTGLEATYQICLNCGLRPDVSVVTDNNSTKYSAIRRNCGIGVAFDNELSLAPLIRDCKLVPVSLFLPVDWLCITWKADQLSATGERFLEFVKGRL